MQSSRRTGRTTAGTRLGVVCAPLAADLERWLIREVDDFERLSPLQSLVLDAWAVLTLAAEGVVDFESQNVAGAASAGPAGECGSETAGAAARTRDAAAVSVVVEARRGLTPPVCVVPATGWSSPRIPPVEGWATHQGGAL